MHKPLEYAIAGLLHDVGKFAQRAHPPGEGLSSEAQRMADYVCPTWQGRQTHLHAAYTVEFFLQHAGNIPDKLDPDVVLRLAAYHHQPTCDSEEILSTADRLSSAMEREQMEDGPSGSGAFRKVELRAVTNEIDIAGTNDNTWSVGLRPLKTSEAFPSIEEGELEDLTEEYHTLWEEFVGAWDRNQVQDAWGFTNRALSVLEQYTWCIPSATNSYPDISLFDHAKTTAAIASCLSIERDADKPFLVVSGDYGGIQEFLFNLQTGAGGLARRLRARSLFVSLAVQNTAHQILREIGLPLTNCIISAGGRFTLLLPNTETTDEVLDDTTSQLAEWTRTELDCELHPHIARLPISQEELHDFGDVLLRLGEELEREKTTALSDVLQTNNAWNPEAFVLDPLHTLDEEGLCASCQRRTGKERKIYEDTVRLCDRCYEDAMVGSQLVRARCIGLSEAEGSLPFGSFELLETEADATGEEYLLIDMDGGCGSAERIPTVGQYIARFVPRDDDGSVTEFGEIAERSSGREALAYLKADVDNLGLIFTSGFSGETGDRRSISRLATLSRSLELFFSGHVQKLAAQFGDTYTVYSGGDDLLLVGPWDQMVQFASRLREDFRRYTCNSPSWSLSAGIVVCGSHTPVLTASGEAETRLEAAKEMSGSSVTAWRPGLQPSDDAPVQKDRLVAFGTSMPWDDAQVALEHAENLLSWLQSDGVSNAQVRRLFRYAKMFQQWQVTGDVRYFQYAPMLVYDIRRNWTKAPKEARAWVNSLTVRDSEDIAVLRFICEYVLNAARGGNGGGR